MNISNKRLERMKSVASLSQLDLAVVLENVHDIHNISAVLRSCDSVGVRDIFILNTDHQLKDEELAMSKTSSSSANKWINIHYFEDREACFKQVKATYKKLFGTHLGIESKSVFEMDFTGPCALMFGNERDGISEESIPFLDGNFIIPQFGMIKSLNISVSCAVSLYEVCRQRLSKEMYDSNLGLQTENHRKLYEEFIARHKIHKEPKE